MLSSKLTVTPETMIMSPYLETQGGVAVMMAVEEVSTMMISIETDIRGVTSWSWLKGGRAIRMNQSIFLVSNYLASMLSHPWTSFFLLKNNLNLSTDRERKRMWWQTWKKLKERMLCTENFCRKDESKRMW